MGETPPTRSGVSMNESTPCNDLAAAIGVAPAVLTALADAIGLDNAAAVFGIPTVYYGAHAADQQTMRAVTNLLDHRPYLYETAHGELRVSPLNVNPRAVLTALVDIPLHQRRL
jgi:hypothetical protein